MSIYLGVLINAGLVVLGGVIGCFVKGNRLKDIGDRIFQVFAFFVLAMGINGAADMSQPVVILVSLVLGVAIGELIDIDKLFNRFGVFIHEKISGEKSMFGHHPGHRATDSRFADGFVQASLLFCIGSMAFMGAMESAMQKTHTIYITKGVLDGLSAMTFAMGFGGGTILAAVSVLVYQGILVSFAALLQPILTESVINLCCTIGSLFLIGVGTNMLGITKIKVANFLPAMFMPILISLIIKL